MARQVGQFATKARKREREERNRDNESERSDELSNQRGEQSRDDRAAMKEIRFCTLRVNPRSPPFVADFSISLSVIPDFI